MAMKKGGLNMGKGIGALIPGGNEPAPVKTAIPKDQILMVDINKVSPNKDQPRKDFNEDSLNELAESIALHGVFQPLLVQEKDGYYEIIAGERRWRAAKLAKIKELPVIVKDLSDREVYEIALLENLQRVDLNPIEEALAYKYLIDAYGMKQDEVAERISKSRSAVTNSLRLLKLEGPVQNMLISGMLTTGHVRPLLGLPEGESQTKIAERIFDENMSAREAENLINKIKKGEDKDKKDKSPKVNTQLEAVYGEIEEKLKAALGTKVTISPKDANKGSIEIEYYSKDQLAELIEKLEG